MIFKDEFLKNITRQINVNIPVILCPFSGTAALRSSIKKKSLTIFSVSKSRSDKMLFDHTVVVSF